MKNASDKFIKDNVEGFSDKSSKTSMKQSKPSSIKRSMTPNTDETISSYPASYASEAASPGVKSKDQDLNMNIDSNKKK